MYFVRVLEKAEKDLDCIADYIAKENPYKAVSFTQELLKSFKNKTSLYPRIGIKCKNFHYLIHGKYFIFYDVWEDKKEVVVLHIIHGANYSAYKKLL